MADIADRRTIAVIDGNSLMHRAFHAIRQPMSAPDGRATNALFGFFNMFVKFVETFSPDGVICAFDKGKPVIRMGKLPQYKAQRPPVDPALHEQFPMVKELLVALDVPVVELEGWEGDDILGTLARRGEDEGYEMLLVTGDRDMYQLSTENVKIVSTKKGTSEVAIMTPDTVEDLYHGITPELVPDFYGLKGDSSDNIPGVPGIGPKKAAALIVEYGSLEGVIEHADEVPGKMGESLRAHIDDARLSREIATIMCDAPIEIDLASAQFPTFDPAKVQSAFAALGFTGMTQRLLKLGGAQTTTPTSVETTKILEPVVDEEAMRLVDDALSSGTWLGVAWEEPEFDGRLQLTFDDAPENAAARLWVAAADGMGSFDGPQASLLLTRLLHEGRIVAADVKALLHRVVPADSSQDAALEISDIEPGRLFDIGVAGYLLDSERSSYEPVSLAQAYLQIMLPEPTDELGAAALEAYASRILIEPLRTAMAQDGCEGLFDEVEMPLLPVLLAMEREGLHVDVSILANQSAELGAEVSRMVNELHQIAGEEFNVDSPMQLSHVLFDVLGLPTKGLKKTQRGYYSTSADVLASLAREYAVVGKVLEYRERAKIKSTYLDALPALVAGDGRIHTSFNQTVAATGRLSSSDPNLQNIPTRSELGHRVRQAFTVPEGYVFLACDYSQIELRLLAHLSGDEHLVAAFNEGADFHAATAARVFGLGVGEVTPEMRSRAKAVNFGIVYGQQAYGLASSLKIPVYEAQEMIDRYFEVYPGVRAFLDGQVAFAREHGWVATMYGRKRHIAGINARNFQQRAFGERTAMNHPMQGSAADIIKIAMVRVAQRLREEGLSSRLVLQIHDELDFEAPIGEVELLSALVRETMEGAAELSVPLIADVSYGPNWAEAK